jgi:hypothetical protein
LEKHLKDLPNPENKMEENFLKKQRKLRIYKLKNFDKFKKLREKYNLPVEVRIKKIKEVNDLKIFLVDGKKIRDSIDIDFTMGGHPFRYIYVPIDEIWVDSSNESEKEEIIMHEIKEFNLMKQGFSYDKAHDQASILEHSYRNKQ